MGCVLVMLVGLTTSTLFMCDYVYQNVTTFSVYNEEGMGSGFVSDGEYLMEGTPAAQLEYEVPVYPGDVVLHQYDKQYLQVYMECENLSEKQESYIDIPILNYRDYRAVTSSGENLSIVNNEKMQIRVVLPAGFHGTVEVGFVSPVYWRISELLSLCAVLLLSGIGIGKSWKRRRCHEKIEV